MLRDINNKIEENRRSHVMAKVEVMNSLEKLLSPLTERVIPTSFYISTRATE